MSPEELIARLRRALEKRHHPVSMSDIESITRDILSKEDGHGAEAATKVFEASVVCPFCRRRYDRVLHAHHGLGDVSAFVFSCCGYVITAEAKREYKAVYE